MASYLNVITDIGIASEMGSGKVRWRTIQENVNGALVSETGASLTSICISTDSEWIAFGRKGHGISIMKLKGSGKEIKVDLTNSGLDSRITALHIKNKKKSNQYTLYAGDQQGVIVAIEFKDEKITPSAPQVISKKLGGITSITHYKNELYVSVNDGVKIVKVDLGSGQPIEEWPFCPTPPINYLGIAKHIKALIFSSQHRHITVYSLNEKTVEYLSSKHIPKYVDISPHFWNQEFQHVLSLSEKGDVSIWKLDSEISNKKPLKPHGKIKLQVKSENTIINATFSRSNKSVIVIAYGTIQNPIFLEIVYVDISTGEIHPKLNVKSQDEKPILNANTLKIEQNKINDNKNEDNNKLNVVGNSNGLANHVTFKGAEQMQIDVEYPQDQPEIPFSQLIQQFNKSNKDKKLKKPLTDLPRTTSAVSALVGALKTNDKDQLKIILSNCDVKFISSTIRQLPLSQVLPLLNELLNDFSDINFNTVMWIRQLLMIQKSYLVSTPDLMEKLSGLYNTIDERLEHFPDLIKLSGRLDLLLSHVENSNYMSKLKEKSPIQSYVEKDDEFDIPESLSESDDDSQSSNTHSKSNEESEEINEDDQDE